MNVNSKQDKIERRLGMILTNIVHPFRTNWWSHYCPVLKKEVWKHKQYMSCSECGKYNGKTEVTRKAL